MTDNRGDARARPDGPGSREPSPSVSALTGFDPSREDIERAHKFLRSLRRPTINSNVPASVAVQAMFLWHEQEKHNGR